MPAYNVDCIHIYLKPSCNLSPKWGNYTSMVTGLSSYNMAVHSCAKVACMRRLLITILQCSVVICCLQNLQACTLVAQGKAAMNFGQLFGAIIKLTQLTKRRGGHLQAFPVEVKASSLAEHAIFLSPSQLSLSLPWPIVGSDSRKRSIKRHDSNMIFPYSNFPAGGM